MQLEPIKITETIERLVPPKKGDKHRALDDIRESIAELKHYKEKWLAPPKPPKEKPKSRAKSGAGSDGDGGAAT